MTWALLSFAEKFFSCPLDRFIPLSLGWRQVVGQWDCGGTDARDCEHCTCVLCSDLSVCHSPCCMLCFLSGCKFAHVKKFLRKSLHMHHLAIFCTDQMRDLKSFSTKGYFRVVCTLTSKGHGGLANKIGFCSYKVSRSICIIVFK